MSTLFLEPGGDATGLPGGIYAPYGTVGTVSVVSDFVHGTHKYSTKFAPAAANSYITLGGGNNNQNFCVSFWIYLHALPSATPVIFEAYDASAGAAIVIVQITSGGIIQIPTNSPIYSGGTLTTGTWHRISLSGAYTSSSTVNDTRLYIDGVLSISIHNVKMGYFLGYQLNNCTIGNGASGYAYDASLDMRVSDIYCDNRSDLSDCGNVWVTAKRPYSNGTTNTFPTQIGSGGSGYGTGHAQQENERPLNTSDGWSTTSNSIEKYNIETISQGDINISSPNYTIIDSLAWIAMAGGANSMTGTWFINGNSYSQMYNQLPYQILTKILGTTAYPAGTGADIGFQGQSGGYATWLYEMGIIFAAIPPTAYSVSLQTGYYVTTGSAITAPVINYTVAAYSCSISANVSDYKWLSSTLKTAQQQPAVQPYYQCRIIDDSVIASAVTYTMYAQPLQGSSCVAPDGTMFTVGRDSLNQHCGVWIMSPTSLITAVSATVILDSSIHNIGSQNHYSIVCSDWIAGGYKVDVYYMGNWDNYYGGGMVTILHWYSLDKGVTWHSDQVANSTGVSNLGTSSFNFWIAGGQPYFNSLGQTVSTVFYITSEGSMPITGQLTQGIAYQQYASSAPGAYSSGTKWSTNCVDSTDWSIHSFDVCLVNGKFYVEFAAFHWQIDATNQNSSVTNYSLYITEIVLMTNSASDIWTAPQQIMSSLSTSPQNLNSFYYPSLYYDGTYLWTTFVGTLVSSISNVSGATSVATTVNHFYAKSLDLVNFNYPVNISFAGVLFTDPNYYSFIMQGGSYWLVGGGYVGQFTINNTIADVSNDILTYEANDTQNNPSTINLDIANANNKWWGQSPTQPGYQAIAANKKVCLFQGYYNAAGIPEVAPKNTYYIDDIEANITNTSNDFNVLGRDFYKNLNVIQTSTACNYIGIRMYNDIFDGTTLNNWTQVSGSWTENSNQLHQNAGGTTALATFNVYQMVKANVTFSLWLKPMSQATNSTSIVDYVYFYYQDSSNWARLSIRGMGISTFWQIAFEQCVGGSTYLNPGNPSWTLQYCNLSNGGLVPLSFTRNAFNQWIILFPQTDSYMGNGIGAFASANTYYVNLANTFGGLGTVAFGSLNDTPYFGNFDYIEFDASQNMSDLTQKIGTKAGIYNYKMPTIFKDSLFTAANYSGSFSVSNRNLAIGPGNTAMKNNLQIANGEIQFVAKMTPVVASSIFYADFIFRDSNATGANENYFFRIYSYPFLGQDSSIPYTTHLGLTYNLQMMPPYNPNPSVNILNNTPVFNFDFTIYHTFKIIFLNGYLFLSIDGIMVSATFDNNVTDSTSVHSTGYIGFRASSNCALYVNSIVGNDMYSQIETLSINPGDDLQSSIATLLENQNLYYFSDLMGRFKVQRLNSSDSPVYTYSNQITQNAVDNSDKEYVNQVIVIGTNVQAIAQNTTSISINAVVRAETIVDYTIMIYADALSRAQTELVSFNKYNNQYTVTVVNDLGAEMYEVVSVINTGANSSGVNQTVRIYSVDAQVGGDNLSYWSTIQVAQM